MYSNETRRLGIDQELAKDCLTSLQGRPEDSNFDAVVEVIAAEGCIQRDQILSSISTYSEGQFSRLVNDISREEEPYHPLVTLFTYINSFFRFNLGDATRDKGWSPGIDAEWEKASDPKLGQPKTDTHQNPQSFLRRRFVVTNKKDGVFSIHIKDDPQPLPGLCSVLHPASFASTNDTELGESYWKNVKIPIGVTLKDRFDANTACQIARCARAVRVEQFDRNVVLNVLLTSGNVGFSIGMQPAAI